ncbi:hypothetical protein CEXT_436601 [Caerostris extrusa]|uniref:Uncharacterized protein n=1 Tax=Caerostris extrusa TaxID=172846 RepID=A0AAV4RLI6_CAEEX|nr:hypothetical protein CEXT_436601 [Caerostris extrusa]
MKFFSDFVSSSKSLSAPYDNQRPSTEADYLAYWVMPPPEHRPHEYGRPMQMIYSIAHDSFLTQDLLMEMRLISEYYRSTGEALDFNSSFSTGSGTFWEKLQSSLRTKLPRDLMVTGTQSTAQAQAVTHFWDFLKGLIMMDEQARCEKRNVATDVKRI